MLKLPMLSVVTWNIDGLSNVHTSLRAMEASRLILQETPDVIMLQECVPENHQIFHRRFLSQGYKCIHDENLSGYYTLSYCKPLWSILASQRLPFNRSMMGRDILKFEISNGQQKVLCLCSHLESCREFGEIRVQQLRQLFEVAHSYQGPVVIGGDLNIRDNEVKSVVHEMRSAHSNFDIKDAWEASGCLKDQKFTWICPGNTKIKCRFDRIFFKPIDVSVPSFKLIGADKLMSTNSAPSDHLGISTRFVLPTPKTVLPPKTVSSPRAKARNIDPGTVELAMEGSEQSSSGKRKARKTTDFAATELTAEGLEQSISVKRRVRKTDSGTVELIGESSERSSPAVKRRARKTDTAAIELDEEASEPSSPTAKRRVRKTKDPGTVELVDGESEEQSPSAKRRAERRELMLQALERRNTTTVAPPNPARDAPPARAADVIDLTHD